MGTRADFYVGNDPATMEWIGSIAYDGYCIHDARQWWDDNPKKIASSTTEQDFRAYVRLLLLDDPKYHGTFPEQGWPWPWKDSRTTDYAYCFVDGKVLCYMFGHGPADIGKSFCNSYGDFRPGLRRKADFPDMTARQKVTLGRRSGVLFLSGD